VKAGNKKFNPAGDSFAANPTQAARDHYDTFGHFERRNTKCAYRITDYQAECYMRRYQDLADAFQDATNPISSAKKHWYKYGFAEKRDPRCYKTSCTDEACKNQYIPKHTNYQQNAWGSSYGGNGNPNFKCNGIAYYGRVDDQPHYGAKENIAAPGKWSVISNFNYATSAAWGDAYKDGSTNIKC
jgi:hypothetical protein